MHTKNKILIVEDEFIVANDLKMILKKNGYEVIGIASSVIQAKEIIQIKQPDWVLLDIILKGGETGIDLAAQLNLWQIPFLYVSANTNQAILEAVKETRPYGFLTKPFRERDLSIMLDIAQSRYQAEHQATDTTDTQIVATASDGLIGQSPLFLDALDKIRLVAPTDTSVLLLGESGTGKEKMAKRVHALSLRKQQNLVVVNCAALPLSLVESELFGHEKGAFTGANARRIGKFEQAQGGTIFLDEIGELPLDAQVKLLRVLQEREIERVGGDQIIKVNVRIIAATNRNLEQEVAQGNFRLDLYYRLNIFPIEIPALRQRQEDIKVLASYFLAIYSERLRKKIQGFSVEALRAMEAYSWPGNIREMEHLIERHVLLAQGNEIREVSLPKVKISDALSATGTMLSLEDIEKMHIIKALETASGKVAGPGGAADILKISSSSLYSKMKKYAIKADFY